MWISNYTGEIAFGFSELVQSIASEIKWCGRRMEFHEMFRSIFSWRRLKQ